MRNAPKSVFWFVNFCLLPFLLKTSINKWKKIWFSYAHKWIGKKEMLAKISNFLCWNLFIGVTTQIRAVYKDHEMLVTLKRCLLLCLYVFRLSTQNIYCFMIVVLTKTFFVYLATVQIRPRLLIWKWTVWNWGQQAHKLGTNWGT